jgi:hypothetical protein
MEASGVSNLERMEFQAQQMQRRAVRQRAVAETRREASEAAIVARVLDAWLNVCSVCHTGIGKGHVVTSCSRGEAPAASDEIKRRRKEIRLDKFSGCWKCCAPYEVCNRWEEKQDGTGWLDTRQSCQYYGIVTSFVFGLEFRNTRLYAIWISRLAQEGVDTTSTQAIDVYLGKRRDKGGVEGSNLLWEFMFIVNGIRRLEDEGWEI